MIRFYLFLSIVLYFSFPLHAQEKQSLLTLKEALTVYPVPAKEGKITLDFGKWNHDFEQVEIYDLTGNKVLDAKVNTRLENKHVLNVSGLARGNYFLLITTPEEVFSKRIAIN